MTQGGGLLQLVATGKQDAFLTGNPQVTWFKMVYRRYSPFAIESQRMYFDGKADFGQKISCVVPRLGDLLGDCFLVVELPPITLVDGTPVGYTQSIGHALIEEISVLIGEQEIDKQNGEWMQIWSKLTTPASQQDGFNEMIGEQAGFPTLTIQGPYTVYIPLRFWFNKNPGLYLPLLALQYHQVRINVTLAPLSKLWYRIGIPNPAWQIAPASITNMQLWGDFVFLDVEERRRFVNTPMEYLIEQVQYTNPFPITAAATSATIKLDFNHPCREFLWVFHRNEVLAQNELFNWSSLSSDDTGTTANDLMIDAVIQLDGQDRFEKRVASYFRLIQPYQRHTTIPIGSYIYNYSFALRPEDLQPSGSLNASRIYNIVLQVTPNNSVGTYPTETRGDMTCTVYTHNHNVLRILDGFGGLLFSV
jgi:hypothetical protein